MLNRWPGADGHEADEISGAAPVAVASGDGVLDAAQFDALRKLVATRGDPGLLRSFVEQYVDQATSQLAELREAAARGDVPTFERVAHGLKGTSGTMGVIGVASAAMALEAAAARGEVAGSEELDRVAAEIDLATAAMRAQAPGSLP